MLWFTYDNNINLTSVFIIYKTIKQLCISTKSSKYICLIEFHCHCSLMYALEVSFVVVIINFVRNNTKL